MSLAVEDPEVKEIVDLASGQSIAHRDVIGDDYEECIQLRFEIKTAIHRRKPRFVCAECFTPVYLISRAAERRFHFRHVLEDGRCSAHTRGALSQDEINARRYNGVKEGPRHRQMKAWLVRSLRADHRFSNIAVERRWFGAIKGAWRQPDISAEWNGIRIAFEIQLSTTFLDVIVGRREFYLAEGGLLFWVFANFDTEGRRLLQDDVFFNNNQNAFLVTRETVDRSRIANRLHLECVWADPTQTAEPSLQRELIAFENLTLDLEGQRVFFFDHDQVVAKQRAAYATNWKAARDAFEAWWLTAPHGKRPDGRGYGDVRSAAAKSGFAMPISLQSLPLQLLNMLYSAKHGRVIGWGFKSFIEVAHRVAIGYKPHLLLFREALRVYARAEQIKREDHTGKWRDKVKQYTSEIQNGNADYTSDDTYLELVRFLFPEISQLN
ncbi:MAG: DUF6035 family protein [Usitatibacteraceae bacterium]